MAYGDAAAEQHEKDQVTDYVREDGSVRAPVRDWEAERSAMLWEARQRDLTRAQQHLAYQQNRLWKFMEARAERGITKPYEICGAEDARHPRHEEGHPDYDEDDLVPHVICQLPRNHRDLGYRNHLEMKDGQISGAWS